MFAERKELVKQERYDARENGHMSSLNVYMTFHCSQIILYCQLNDRLSDLGSQAVGIMILITGDETKRSGGAEIDC